MVRDVSGHVSSAHHLSLSRINVLAAELMSVLSLPIINPAADILQ